MTIEKNPYIWLFFSRQTMKRQQFIDYLLLLAIAITGMWQLVFGYGTMKWDAIDLYQPWKYYITESINNGYLPLWHPFANSGFAQMGDPGTWYPISWILGLFGKYGLHMVGIEYVLHIFIAGVGFHKISQHFGFRRSVQLLLAVSYMFSGFFISNAQHNGWMNSGAWLPFVFYYFLLSTKKPTFSIAVKLAIVLFLSLSGGYPGIFILTGYSLLFAYFGFFIQKIKTKDIKQLKKTTIHLTIAAVLFAIFSSPVLISAFETSHDITRGDAMSLERVLVGSLTIPSLLSFLFPYTLANGSDTFFLDTLTILNSFWGFISLTVLIFALFHGKQDKRARHFALIGLFFLIMALGKDLPLRKWLYYALPFMGHTRFPSIARIFSIFFFLLATGVGYEHLLSPKKQDVPFSKYFMGVGVLLITGLIFLATTTDISHISTLFSEGFYSFTKNALLTEKIVVQGSLFALEIIALLIFKKYWKTILPAIVILEMIISVQLNTGATIIERKSPFPTDKIINSLPDDYPIPDLKMLQYKTTDDFFRYSLPMIKFNHGIFYKIPAIGGNSPYGYKTYKKASENGDFVKETKFPLLYFRPSSTKKQSPPTDDNFTGTVDNIIIKTFNPNEITVKVIAPTDGEIVFLQNHQRHWTAEIDGKQCEITPFATTFMKIPITKGQHNVTFQYRPKAAILAFYIGYSLLTLALLYLAFLSIQKRGHENDYAIILLWIAAFAIAAIFIQRNFAKRISNEELYSFIDDKIRGIQVENGKKKVAILANTDSALSFKNVKNIRSDTECGWCTIDSLLEHFDEPYLCYVEANVFSRKGIFDLIKTKYPKQLSMERSGNASIYLFEKGDFTNREKMLYFDSVGVITDTTGLLSRDFHFKKGKKFGLSSSIKYGKIKGKKLRFSFSMKLPEGIAPTLVVQANKNGKSVFWKGFEINQYCRSRGEWFDMVLYFDAEEIENLSPKDLIKVFFWNNGKKEVWVRDFETEVLY